jgi:hypothetical protein
MRTSISARMSAWRAALGEKRVADRPHAAVALFLPKAKGRPKGGPCSILEAGIA